MILEKEREELEAGSKIFRLIIGSSLRVMSDYNLRGTLVTYGTCDTCGWYYLAGIVEQEDVEDHKIIQCSHRSVCIFDHCDHVSSSGRHCSAQAEFIDIFSLALGAKVFSQQFRKMIY